jgi:ferrochelatase
MLVNLGTPEAPEAGPVRRYLREFLGDPRVLDMNPLGRWLLLHLVILPFRPRRSAAAYRKIWTERGSPLLAHARDLAAKVAAALGEGAAEVEVAMRYGAPSIASALERFRARGTDRIVVFPLFPQRSSAAWGSAVAKVFAEAGRLQEVPALHVVPPFYDDPRFLAAAQAVARPALAAFRPDRVVMSFHGLPERQVRKSDPSGAHCLGSASCCDAIVAANRQCYRAQCFATARALAARLDLVPGSYDVAFQSRLGREPWIRPYFDRLVRELAGRGVKRLAVLSPAFVADCLETLEEIGIRAREDFRAHGGEDLLLVPSLNSEPAWVEAVASIAREAGAGRNQPSDMSNQDT